MEQWLYMALGYATASYCRVTCSMDGLMVDTCLHINCESTEDWLDCQACSNWFEFSCAGMLRNSKLKKDAFPPYWLSALKLLIFLSSFVLVYNLNCCSLVCRLWFIIIIDPDMVLTSGDLQGFFYSSRGGGSLKCGLIRIAPTSRRLKKLWPINLCRMPTFITILAKHIVINISKITLLIHTTQCQ